MAATEVAERSTPVTALRLQSRTSLSEHLNPTKVIPAPGGLPRDWRGLADLCDVPTPGPGTVGEKDPTDTILTAWQKKDIASASIERLCQFLEQLDRFDILDDLEACISDDVQRYWDRLDNDNQIQPFSDSNSLDESILTIDDIQRISSGLPPQNYHAFVLFADEDKEFGVRIVETLENDYNLKICYKDRDLVGGINFEHEAIVRLVSERCNHLVVILSNNFVRSNPVNKFYTNFAQAQGIVEKKRKVVPLNYNCDFELIPPQLKYHYMLDWRKENFFTILNRSIGCAPTLANTIGSCTIRELTSSSSCSSKSSSPSQTIRCKTTEDMDFDKDLNKLDLPISSQNRLSVSEKNLCTSEKLSDCARSNNNVSESFISTNKNSIKETTFFKSLKITKIKNILRRKKKLPVPA